MEIQEPPVYESKESYGMKGWFSSVYRFIKRRTAITNQTAAYTVSDNIFYVRMDATGGARTVTLPAALKYEGRQILVTKIDTSANAVTLSPSGSDTIQGATSLVLSGQWYRALVVSDGNTTWDLIEVVGTLSASLGADVALNNTANYFDGPSVAQGTKGTWFVSGTVTLIDTVNAAMSTKLWDGTTVIASAKTNASIGNQETSLSLSGYITNPVGNLRISCKDLTSVNGKIIFNATGNSKDSTITAIRIV